MVVELQVQCVPSGTVWKGIKMVEGEAYKAPSDVAEEGFMVVE